MQWLNIKLSTLRNPVYMGANPVERATWLQLLAYCIDQENGGRIPGGARWKDRQWQQTCGVTLREVKTSGQLLFNEGEDVCVHFYPSDKETEVRQMREAGQKGAQKRWNKSGQPAKHNGGGDRGAITNPISDAAGSANGDAARNANSDAADNPASGAVAVANEAADEGASDDFIDSVNAELERNNKDKEKDKYKEKGNITTPIPPLGPPMAPHMQQLAQRLCRLYGEGKRLGGVEKDIFENAEVSEADVALVEQWFARGRKVADYKLPQSLESLLANWSRCLDRARVLAQKYAAPTGAAPASQRPQPPGLAEWIAKHYPEFAREGWQWHEVRLDVARHFMREHPQMRFGGALGQFYEGRKE